MRRATLTTSVTYNMFNVCNAQLKLNGNHITDFAHRLPKEGAQFIVIKGEVSINFPQVRLRGRREYPASFMESSPFIVFLTPLTPFGH